MVALEVGAAVSPATARQLRLRAQDIRRELTQKHGVPALLLDELVGIERLLATNPDTVRASFEQILRTPPDKPIGAAQRQTLERWPDAVAVQTTVGWMIFIDKESKAYIGIGQTEHDAWLHAAHCPPHLDAELRANRKYAIPPEEKAPA